MARMLIFGLGYSGKAIAARLREEGWHVDATGRDGNVAFDAADRALRDATHVVSTVPPSEGGDPVLTGFGKGLAGKWLGYLSSTGVYGDARGGWVDEHAPVRGRRPERNAADAAWCDIGARVFRLPGIYGLGRSALDRVAGGQAHRIPSDEQVFSRIHVDDIASAVAAALTGPPGAYNIADDRPASQNAVVTEAARLLGVAAPPIVPLETLGSASRAFYAENRRVANGKAKRVLGWAPAYPDFVAGLRALSAMSRPMNASTPPDAASRLHR